MKPPRAPADDLGGPRPLGSGLRSDEELLAAVAAGDRQAFSELYDRVARQVYRVVRRVLRDQARLRDRDRPFDEVAEEVGTRLEHERVRAGLEGLTELQREAIELAYYEGHSYRDVAALLDAPLGTIKTRVRDGLRRLRRNMDSSAA